MSGPRPHELSDFEWPIIEPLLTNKPRGGMGGMAGDDTSVEEEIVRVIEQAIDQRAS